MSLVQDFPHFQLAQLQLLAIFVQLLGLRFQRLGILGQGGNELLRFLQKSAGGVNGRTNFDRLPDFSVSPVSSTLFWQVVS